MLPSKGGHLRVAVRLGGCDVVLRLNRWTLRSRDFELWIEDERGLHEIESVPPPWTVRGVVEDDPQSRVTGMLKEGELTVSIRLTGGAEWGVHPVSRWLDNAPAKLHAVHAAADLLPLNGHCGSDDGGRKSRPKRPAPVPGPPAVLAATQVCELSIDSDVEFYQTLGSVVAAVDWMETSLVGVDEIYRRDVGISYVVNRIYVRTVEPDPYDQTEGAELRDQLGDWWDDNRDDYEWDLVHLFTGKDIWSESYGNGLWGIANIGEVCDRDDDGAFAVSEYKEPLGTQVALLSHEMGHNWDGTHCNDDPPCYIMCSDVRGGPCAGDNTRFGWRAQGEIVEFRDDIDCLSTSRPAIYVNGAYRGAEDGTYTQPYDTVREGAWAVDPGGDLMMWGGTYDEAGTLKRLDRAMTLRAVSGTGNARLE